MKNILLLFLLSIINLNNLNAQKHDYNWVTGNSVDKPSINFSLYNLNFSEDSLKVIALSTADSTRIWMSNYYTTSYSDKDGVLKFITNGLRIYDASFGTMLNGDSLNPGKIWNDSNKKGNGYQSVRGICALPAPENTEKYTYLIHQGLDTSKTWLSYLFANPLYMTKIDMDGNGGLCEVIEKNIIIDTGRFEPLAAVKHANGRDWWIIMPEFYFNKYHTLLLTPEGIKGPWIQEIGPNFKLDQGSFTVSEFSPQGDKFVRGWITEGKTVIFDFDRCSGLLSNTKELLYPDTLLIVINLFSPAGKYLYLTSYYYGKLYQVDLENANLELVEIADFNNSFCHNKSNKPGYLANGPDGNIYITGGELKHCISVIHSPDKAFPDCGIQFSKIEIPYFNLSFPYFPNYRLGPLVGSVCDTITSSHEELTNKNPIAKVYPNPANEDITLELMHHLQHNENLEVNLIDISGKVLYKGKIPPYAFIHKIDINSIPDGIYCILIKGKEKLLGSVKVIKQ